MTRPTRYASASLCALTLLCTRAVLAQSTPFEPLSVAEQRTAFEVVSTHFRDDAALPDGPLNWPLLTLAEPSKASVLAWKQKQQGQQEQHASLPPRRAQVHVLHHPSNRAWQVSVDLQTRSILQLTQILGQPALTSEEYEAAAKLVRAHKPWQRALRLRKLDPALTYLDIWAGHPSSLSDAERARSSFGDKTRLVHAITFTKRGASSGPDNPYDRPVEGLVVTLDMNARRVLACVDRGERPVSTESGNAPEGTQSSALKPLQVRQPEGSDLRIAGHLVRYRNWQFYAVLQPREGLVLYDVRFHDGKQLRQVAYRMALSEIYVPYGIGDAAWSFRMALDVGEYNPGLSAQHLLLGHDVPNNAYLFDTTFFSDRGPTQDNPQGTVQAPGTLAIYERASGLLWTRTDPDTRLRDSRDGREVVASWSAWLGNYIYSFEWIFKLDGSIEVRAQLHGTTLNRGALTEPEASAPKVGRDAHGTFVAAPHHQHFVSYRLDLDIDGPHNRLMQMEVVPLDQPPFKNAFDTRMQYLTAEGYRDFDPQHMRHWHVESGNTRNALAKPTSYALEPEALIFPYSAPDYEGLLRAPFAAHALWFSRQRDDERYASGDFPYQSEAGAGKSVGVANFVSPAEVLDGEDIVLWYTTGFTHIARPEDYPVMPVESVSFKLMPRGFFDRNPALDIPGH